MQASARDQIKRLRNGVNTHRLFGFTEQAQNRDCTRYGRHCPCTHGWLYLFCRGGKLCRWFNHGNHHKQSIVLIQLIFLFDNGKVCRYIEQYSVHLYTFDQ